jgi:hypothetical protein
MSSFPKLLLSLVDGLRFGQANICKHSIVKFQQCFALPPSIAAPNCERNPVGHGKRPRAA